MGKGALEGSIRAKFVAASAACLILMFLGAWTCDAALLASADLYGGYLSLRCVSLLAYGLVVAVLGVLLRRVAGESLLERREHAARLLRNLLGFGAVALLIGSLGLMAGVAEEGMGAYLCAFLVKCVGPPLSIGVLLLFARVDESWAVKMAAVAMGVAFLGECGLHGLLAAWAVGGAAMLAVGVLLQLVGCAVTAVLLGGRKGSAPAPSNDALDQSVLSSAKQESVKTERTRRVGQALLCIAATGLMLGYLRSGASPGNAVGPASAMAVLVALGASAWCLPRIDTRALFGIATICVAAAFLLRPLIEMIAPGATAMLADVGTILFEVLIWVMSLSLVRKGAVPVLYAAGARLAAVCGHGAGTLLAVGSVLFAQASPEWSQVAPTTILFIYVVMLVVFGRTLPAGLALGEQAPQPSAKEQQLVENAEVARGADYWAAPCRDIAQTWSLTPRETEVLEQLAQGRDLAFMEEKFVLSRNTVKMHVRNVYAKLGVHSKQEVIDLVDRVRGELVNR